MSQLNLMKKLKAITYFLLGAASLLSAVMTPAYLRSVDSGVLRTAGGKPGLISEGFALLRLGKTRPRAHPFAKRSVQRIGWRKRA